MAILTRISHARQLTWSRIFSFSKFELRKNIIPILIPAPLIVILWFYQLCHGRPFFPGSTGGWIYLTMLFFIALVYGLSCFSSEADRKTLDFLLTRPLSPFLITAGKYLTTLVFLLSWVLLSHFLIAFTPATVGLPKEIGFEWILIFVVLTHSMSCFAGLLAKGLERFLVIVILSGLLGGFSYLLWWQLFNLVRSNYYLPDTPPRLDYFVTVIMPYVFLLLSLWIPFTGTWWMLKNRIKLWLFTPAMVGLGAWLTVFLLILSAEFVFAPVLEPLKTAKLADWHPRAGIVVTGPVAAEFEFQHIPPKKLARIPITEMIRIGKPWHKTRSIYQGYDIRSPHFSPDGQTLLFCEQGRIKLMDLNKHTIKTVGFGSAASWALDGCSLLFAQTTANKQQSRLMVYSLKTGKIALQSRFPFPIYYLAWDSRAAKVYLFSNHSAVHVYNLKKRLDTKLHPTEPKQTIYDYEIFPPTLVLNSSARLLFVGQVIGRDYYLYSIDLKKDSISLLENESDYRIKNGAPLIINSKGTYLVWPRVDGGFQYQSTYYNFSLHDTD